MDQKLYEIEKLASDNFPKLLTLNVRVIEQSVTENNNIIIIPTIRPIFLPLSARTTINQFVVLIFCLN